MKKIGFILTVPALLMGLGGCSQQHNPLTQYDTTQTARFLVHASEVAEKQLGRTPDGYAYGRCMKGEHNQTFCHKLYQAMLGYAKTQPDYQTLTQADLTNLSAWKMNQNDYERISFNQF